nr:xanthine dehydrogenase subunit D [Paenibacillus sp. UNC451MF]
MLLTKETAGTRWHIRPDGPEKVTGALSYLTDRHMDGMLHGKVLRSEHAHAWILSIRTDIAEKLPGVRAVITCKDVPGMNRFGIAIPDQPVLCEDRVRYVGDAVAAVAADSLDIAEKALELIEVTYVQLPVLEDPEEAMKPEALKLHPSGNVLHRTNYKRGDAEAAFRECAFVVEETYYTPRQMHAYMETEGGLFVPEADGRLTVYAPTQHGYKDRMQLSRILAMPEEDIRIVSSPIGGSFGGKDELNIQPFGALLALKSGRPVKIHQNRWESVRSGLKRHPMKITMRTGANAEGRLVAHQVRIIADTGAYATLGPAVLNFATEHAMGPYRMIHVDVEGVSVYTNNGVSGEFRGFGGNQVIFALEGQIDRLAAKLGMDPWEFRSMNLREKDDPGPMGQRIVATEGARQVWNSINQSDVWLRKASCGSREGQLPWIHRGIGASVAMHGSGLGFGLPDFGGGKLCLNRSGKIEAAFGYEEFGQGLLSTLQIMLLDHFGCDKEDVEMIIGDTDRAPHSGSSTASRATTMLWQALQRMRQPFVDKLLKEAARQTGVAAEEMETGPRGIWMRSELQAAKEEGNKSVPLVTYKHLADEAQEPIRVASQIHFPTTPDAVVGGHFLYTYTGVAVEVEVDTLTGRVRVLDQFHAVAAGPVINPMGFLGQIEGGSSMALGFTLMEDALMVSGHYVTRNLDAYLVPTLPDTPAKFSLEAIEELPEGDPYGPRGIGEIGTVAVAPAIAAAVRDATNRWVTRLPITPEQLIETVDLGKGGGCYEEG